MSDLVGNPEVRFSRVKAHLKYQLLQTAVNSSSNHYKLSSQLLDFLICQSLPNGDFEG